MGPAPLAAASLQMAMQLLCTGRHMELGQCLCSFADTGLVLPRTGEFRGRSLTFLGVSLPLVLQKRPLCRL